MNKKVLIVMLCCQSIVGCRSQHEIAYKEQMKEAYLYTFKLTYFTKILTKGFNNSEAIKEAMAKDGSGFGEPLLSFEDYKLIDTLVTMDNTKMVQDSINRIGKVAEGAQGKHVLTTALYKFQSKWLDSLAKARYKTFYRNSNTDQ